MKILIVTDSLFPQLGGSYKAVTDTHKIIAKNKKHRSRIVFSRGFFFKKKIDYIYLIKNFDLIHYFGGWNFFHFKIIFLSLLFKKKIIITPMGIFDEWSLNQKKIKKKIALNIYQKFLLNKVNLIHVTSEDEKESLKKISRNKKITYIPHGIESIESETKKFFQGNKKKALFFSRLHEKKGIIDLIDSWLNIKNKEWELHIYGPDYGNYTKIIKDKIKNNPSIILYESVFNKKKELLKKYDLFVLPSKSENFGYVILEALQLGLPVLTTNKTPWEIIKTRNAGWIINAEKKDLEYMLKKIFLTSKDDFEQKSINAISLSKDYSWDNLKEKYFQMYDEVYQDD
jgi:glycosyltransferase involved in cell wall biosynthesis